MEHDAFYVMFTFTNREEYLAQVAAWKEEYKELSKQIRAVKLEIKKEHREKGFTYLWYDLNNLKNDARNAIDARHQSKIDAARQYEEAHATA